MQCHFGKPFTNSLAFLKMPFPASNIYHSIVTCIRNTVMEIRSWDETHVLLTNNKHSWIYNTDISISIQLIWLNIGLRSLENHGNMKKSYSESLSWNRNYNSQKIKSSTVFGLGSGMENRAADKWVLNQ